MLSVTACESLLLLNWVWGECGAVKQWEMTSLLCAHCLPASRAGAVCLSEPEIGLEHTKACSNSFCHFHLILSVSRIQRPLIFLFIFLKQFFVRKSYHQRWFSYGCFYDPCLKLSKNLLTHFLFTIQKCNSLFAITWLFIQMTGDQTTCGCFSPITWLQTKNKIFCVISCLF
jgi:hypothetical protein